MDSSFEMFLPTDHPHHIQQEVDPRPPRRNCSLEQQHNSTGEDSPENQTHVQHRFGEQESPPLRHVQCEAYDSTSTSRSMR